MTAALARSSYSNVSVFSRPCRELSEWCLDFLWQTVPRLTDQRLKIFVHQKLREPFLSSIAPCRQTYSVKGANSKPILQLW